MSKQLQINSELFFNLVNYFFPDDEKDFPTGYAADIIRKQLRDKMQTVINRELFSRYKTAKTPEERERYRREYLAERGISPKFISDIEKRYGDI